MRQFAQEVFRASPPGQQGIEPGEFGFDQTQYPRDRPEERVPLWAENSQTAPMHSSTAPRGSSQRIGRLVPDMKPTFFPPMMDLFYHNFPGCTQTNSSGTVSVL